MMTMKQLQTLKDLLGNEARKTRILKLYNDFCTHYEAGRDAEARRNYDLLKQELDALIVLFA